MGIRAVRFSFALSVIVLGAGCGSAPQEEQNTEAVQSPEAVQLSQNRRSSPHCSGSRPCAPRPNETATCLRGSCVYSCNSGFADCNGNQADGCEVNVGSDPQNCGACGALCQAGANQQPTCSGGRCGTVCNAGFGDCNGSAADGCESNLAGDPSNCGACGSACLALANETAFCSFGVCGASCNAGFADCNGSGIDGCETSLANDANNCGACGHVCSAGPNQVAICANGTCTAACRAGYADCNGASADGCEVNLTTDSANCGVCGNDCNASLSCTHSICSSATCQAPFDASRCLAPNRSSGAGTCAFANAGCPVVDSDGDGLPDVWEDNGAIDLNCDGAFDSNDVALPASDSRVKDVYLSIQYMIPSPNLYSILNCPSPSPSPSPSEPPYGHRPFAESINLVVRAFAGAHLLSEAQPCGSSHVDYRVSTTELVPDSPCPNGFSCVDFACLPNCTTDSDCAASCNDDCQAVGGAHCVPNDAGSRVCRLWRLHVDPLPATGVEHHDIITYGPLPDTCTNTAGGGSGTPGDSVDFYRYKSANFNPKEAAFKHFVLFAHDNTCYGTGSPGCGDPSCPSVFGSAPQPGTTGLSEIRGNDMIVSLGAHQIGDSGVTRVLEEAGVLMHELGHNLGLDHGGPLPLPNRPLKPNYISVMNLLYELGGISYSDTAGSTVPITSRPDYSHQALALSLDESSLNEADGIGAPGLAEPFSRALVRFSGPSTPVMPCPVDSCGAPQNNCFRFGSAALVGGAITPIDWNSNGVIDSSPVSQDINASGSLEVLDPAGSNDWTNLSYSFQCLPTYAN